MAITLTTTYQKVKDTLVLQSGSYKGYVRIYAKYNSQDIANGQTIISIEKRFWYNMGSSNAYTFDGATSRVKINTDAGWTTKSYTSRTSFYGGAERVIQTITRTIDHAQDGTSPIITISSTWTDTIGGSENTSVEIQAPKMNRFPIIETAPDFTDEDSPTITYTDTLGVENATVEIGIFNNTGDITLVPYRQVNVSNKSYTFTFTSNEIATLQQNNLNETNRIMIKLLTSYGNGQTYYSFKMVNFTVINDTATISYTSTENNASVLAQGNYYIQNASNRTFTITIQTKKYNTLSKVYFTHDTTSQEITPTTSDTGANKTYTIVVSSISIRNNAIRIRYTGTRGKDVSTDYTLTPYGEYLKADITNVDVSRPSPTSNNIIVNLEAIYYGNVNAGGTTISNTPTLKYKIESGNYTTISSSAYTIDTQNHKITMSNYTINNGLSYTTNGNIELYLEDIFTNDTENRNVKKGVPTFDYGEHDLQINGVLYIADTDRNNAVNVLNEIENAKLKTYSTTEEIVGTWLNGETIYRQTFEGTFTANSSATTQSNTTLVANADKLIRAYGTYNPNGNTPIYNLGGVCSGTSQLLDAYASVLKHTTMGIILREKTYASNWYGATGSYSITVEYTKVEVEE